MSKVVSASLREGEGLALRDVQDEKFPRTHGVSMPNAGGEPLARGTIPEAVDLPRDSAGAGTTASARFRSRDPVALVEWEDAFRPSSFGHVAVRDRQLEVLGEPRALAASEFLNGTIC